MNPTKPTKIGICPKDNLVLWRLPNGNFWYTPAKEIPKPNAKGWSYERGIEWATIPGAWEGSPNPWSRPLDTEILESADPDSRQKLIVLKLLCQ